ncbi:hypothetical protein IKF81_02175, partial [Candidatus Saccharibacteria bacterium]|nr:hypothetical protein [Candidatus Saccharibacteria bacterium]
SRGDYERTQSMAGVSRIALCSARLVDAGNPPEFSRYKGEVGVAFKSLLPELSAARRRYQSLAPTLSFPDTKEK